MQLTSEIERMRVRERLDALERTPVNRVAFADLDRMIDGEIILQPEQTTDAGLMAAYDKGGYLPSTGILVRDYLRELAGELL